MLPQCLHLMAASWISSAQNGHVFMLGASTEVVGVIIAGVVCRPGIRSRLQCGHTVAESSMSSWQKRHLLIVLSYRAGLIPQLGLRSEPPSVHKRTRRLCSG